MTFTSTTTTFIDHDISNHALHPIKALEWTEMPLKLDVRSHRMALKWLQVSPKDKRWGKSDTGVFKAVLNQWENHLNPITVHFSALFFHTRVLIHELLPKFCSPPQILRNQCKQAQGRTVCFDNAGKWGKRSLIQANALLKRGYVAEWLFICIWKQRV